MFKKILLISSVLVMWSAKEAHAGGPFSCLFYKVPEPAPPSGSTCGLTVDECIVIRRSMMESGILQDPGPCTPVKPVWLFYHKDPKHPAKGTSSFITHSLEFCNWERETIAIKSHHAQTSKCMLVEDPDDVLPYGDQSDKFFKDK